MNSAIAILRLTLVETQIIIPDKDNRNVWFTAWN